MRSLCGSYSCSHFVLAKLKCWVCPALVRAVNVLCTPREDCLCFGTLQPSCRTCQDSQDMLHVAGSDGCDWPLCLGSWKGSPPL